MKARPITPNLIQLTRFRFVNAFLVREADGFTLVDTTMGKAAPSLIDAASSAGGEIRRIALTHGHGDHVGETVAIGRKTGAKLVATMDLAVALTRLLGYPAEQATVETTGFFGGRVPILDGDVISRLVPAIHGGAIAKDETSTPYLGSPASGVSAVTL